MRSIFKAPAYRFNGCDLFSATLAAISVKLSKVYSVFGSMALSLVTQTDRRNLTICHKKHYN